jgi:hypothetical protein
VIGVKKVPPVRARLRLADIGEGAGLRRNDAKVARAQSFDLSDLGRVRLPLRKGGNIYKCQGSSTQRLGIAAAKIPGRHARSPPSGPGSAGVSDWRNG